MRVLVLENGNLIAMEITEIGYDENLEDYDDIEASGSGLFFFSGDLAYGFPGLDKYSCETIVRETYRNGMYDLSHLGEVK